MNRIVASVGTLFLLSACQTLPTERGLVGTWTSPHTTIQNEFGMTQSHSKQMVDATFTPDHRYVWSLHGHRPTVRGRWALSGRHLVTEFTTREHSRNVTRQYRDKITKLSDRELIFPEGEWTRVR